ncbi:hypothetical protein K504DRAFT_401532 [Pleomassaria siparia CBS 279.74]|uniref:Zn(2)-C6 fungal-type domain-containing protein n=1 Tax=Pleomassaria siparia CBS 279.74 TaxID=1314801 RepID=A0A6G1KJG4_9PLEO|nr:hypothetical protein K504DRAFT_401532 [Pleomassaria siparia CBS 279.74]
MAETITIPSPSLFLNSPGPLPSPTTVNKTARRPQQSPTDAPKASDSNIITKRKQSKSRNGCITCKTKRLKCDETKPTCQQCAKRSVACGGYKKDFKWRPFEEASFTGKPPGKTKKALSPSTSTSTLFAHGPLGSDDSQHIVMNHSLHDTYFPPQPSGPITHVLPPTTSYMEPSYPLIGDMYAIPQASPYMLAPPVSPMDHLTPGSLESANTLFETESICTRKNRNTAPSSVSSGQSPRLVDLLLPDTDMSMPPEEYWPFISRHENIYHTGLTPPAEPVDEDDVEQVPRDFHADSESWVMRLPSPAPSSSSSSSSSSCESRDYLLLNQPQFHMTSPEMLTRRFDRDTCGILSVKDGPTENPWRTLVWPLARDCPALYHAIASMTSFHQSRDSPSMRLQGIDHMRTSVHALASSMENMRFDAAISTTLVLAFSESWDSHISTGINHIKGAKILIDRALVRHTQVPVLGEDFNRLKFLCNAWIYMDVIARLTSADDDESNDFDLVSDSIYMTGQTDAELDPLMGCASSLFPIIGRVANLVRKVRRTDSNSPTIISQAMALKSQLEDWVPPAFIVDPEDETTSPTDSIKTSTAYQYATLLYLHQAVPEIPSLPSAILAKKVMCELATVRPTSRSTIVHIYPLMAAGCEAIDPEDRSWVRERWDQMSTRMKLGILEKCLDVTKEVWNRRDAYAAQLAANEFERNETMSATTSPLKRDFSSLSEDLDDEDTFCWVDAGTKRRALNGETSSDGPRPFPLKQERLEPRRRPEIGTELLDIGFTVKGRLHWLGVMKDWNWEVLLG